MEMDPRPPAHGEVTVLGHSKSLYGRGGFGTKTGQTPWAFQCQEPGSAARVAEALGCEP